MAVAAAVALAVSGTTALSQDEQTVVLVANLGKLTNVDLETSSRVSQRFDTGSNLHGYLLTSVRVISEDLEGDAFSAELCGVNEDDGPTGSCTALTAPASFEKGHVVFTAPSNTWLAKDRRYAVVLTPAAGRTITYGTVRVDSQSGLPGWNLAGEFRLQDGPLWVADPESRTLRMRLEGAQSSTSPNIAPTGLPTISGIAQVGQELSADVSAIADDNGLDNVVWSYQWVRVDGMQETDIGEATSSTYTLAGADTGKQIRVKVTFNDDAGNAEGPLASAPYPAMGLVVGPAVTVTGADDLVTTEAGGTASFQVRLATQPSSDVAVAPASSDPGEGAVPGHLTFTDSNWSMPQTVTVTGVDDSDADGDQRYDITFTVTSGDSGYDGIVVPPVSVTNIDDERLPLSLDVIAGDDRVNIAEKAAGFAIGGYTGTKVFAPRKTPDEAGQFRTKPLK